MTTREIVDEAIVVEHHPVLRRRVALVLPVIPEAAPYRIREGIARRRIAAVTGTFPCGALTAYGEPRAGQVGIGEVRHERDCPATTATLTKAIRRWAR